MAISQRTVGAGITGSSLGLVGGELEAQAVERGFITQRTGNVLAMSSTVSSLGVAGLALTDTVALPGGTAPFALGLGWGSAIWYLGRQEGLFPRITLDPPQEVSLTGPFISAVVFTGVALSASWLISRV